MRGPGAGGSTAGVPVARASIDLRAEPARTGAPSSPPAIRLRGIEGLRAVAAVMVLLLHVWRYGSPGGAPADLGPVNQLMPHMGAGVLLFFTLSGFLLYRPFAAGMLRDVRTPSTAVYARNRALRVLPAYWVILIISGVVFGSALLRKPGGALEVGNLMDEPPTLVADLALVQSYTPGTLLTGIGPSWSLVVEVAFYAVLPVLGWLGAMAARGRERRGRVGAALMPPLLLLTIGLTTKLVLTAVARDGAGWDADWSSVAARSFVASADLFAFGMVLAVVRAQVEDGRLRMPRWWRGASVVTGAALFAIAAFVVDGELGEAKYDTVATIGLSLCVAPLLVPRGRSRPVGSVLAVLETRPVTAVGLASYSLFLWHEPLLHWLRGRGWTQGIDVSGFLRDLVLVAVVGGALSALTYRFVERPALRRKRHLAPSRDADRPRFAENETVS